MQLHCDGAYEEQPQIDTLHEQIQTISKREEQDAFSSEGVKEDLNTGRKSGMQSAAWIVLEAVD